MTRRKDRVLVVLDANVIVRALMDPRGKSASARTFRLWLQHRLQLVLSDSIEAEYLEVLARLGIRDSLIQRFADRLRERRTATHVSPGQRILVCRDPDDAPLLEAAQAGRARYLITNDRDLLEIAAADRQGLSFEIVTPVDFLSCLQTPGLQHPYH